MRYNVLILYPEHLADFYGECFLWTGEADSEDTATNQAKWDMVEANADPDNLFDDLIVSLVVKGGEVL